VFWAFRIMVGVGLLMLAVSWSTAFTFAPWKKDASSTLQTWQARVLVGMTFAGWVALIAGWYTTEIGRQPWLVSGLLTTAQAASTVVTAPKIALTLVLYLALYAALIIAYVSVVFYLARHKQHASKPFGDDAAEGAGADLEDHLNVVNYPEKEGRNKNNPQEPLHV
jgi:cytochrome d ubiquinol oxidase subunit I